MTDTTRAELRQYSPLDQLLASFGDGLKSLAAAGASHRARPASDPATLSEVERAEAASLMRVNH
ncbi:MAG: hypothetical protein Q7J29_00610, partial [Stagnimonas sp.]|nr:hypothetical protein [Stagnimonas sp.]